MGAGIEGPALLIVILIACGLYAVSEAKVVAHKAKCGVLHVVGKHCDPPSSTDPQP